MVKRYDKIKDSTFLGFYNNDTLVKEEINYRGINEIRTYTDNQVSYYSIKTKNSEKQFIYTNGVLTSYVVKDKNYTKIAENPYKVKKGLESSEEGVVKLGKKVGTWNYKHQNGTKAIMEYKNDTLIGKAVSFYANGDTFGIKEVKSGGTYISLKAYYPTGELMYSSVKDSNKINTKRYFKSGILHQEVFVKDSLLLTLKTYNDKGIAMPEATVTNGNGTFCTYEIEQNNLKLLVKAKIKSGLFHGTYESNKNEEVEKENYEKGRLIYSDGDISSIINKFSEESLLKEFNLYQEAGFNGGEDKLLEFINVFFKMPRAAMEMGISGFVLIQFIVEKDGSLSEIKPALPVERRLGYGLEEEAIKVIGHTNGKWYPAQIFGFPVRSNWRFPFQIENGF